MSQKMRYELTTLGACCGEDILYFDSLDSMLLDGYDFGTVIMQIKEDCGHWDNKVRYELENGLFEQRGVPTK